MKLYKHIDTIKEANDNEHVIKRKIIYYIIGGILIYKLFTFFETWPISQETIYQEQPYTFAQ
jgi:ribonucleotide reductase beta subunit family protein with ferritin-like domain